MSLFEHDNSSKREYEFHEAEEERNDSDCNFNEQHISSNKAKVNAEQHWEYSKQHKHHHCHSVLCSITMIAKIKSENLDKEKEENACNFKFPNTRRIQ